MTNKYLEKIAKPRYSPLNNIYIADKGAPAQRIWTHQDVHSQGGQQAKAKILSGAPLVSGLGKGKQNDK